MDDLHLCSLADGVFNYVVEQYECFHTAVPATHACTKHQCYTTGRVPAEMTASSGRFPYGVQAERELLLLLV